MSARWDVRPAMRPMAPSDLRHVLVIERAIYEFPWTEGNFRDALVAGYAAAVIEVSGFLAGYRVMMMGPGEAHLLNLSVAADWQRRGLGRRLLLDALRDARSEGAAALFLEVRPSNAAGIALYADIGFQRIGVRKGYYPAVDGREDAWVMSLPL